MIVDEMLLCVLLAVRVGAGGCRRNPVQLFGTAHMPGAQRPSSPWAQGLGCTGPFVRGSDRMTVFGGARRWPWASDEGVRRSNQFRLKLGKSRR